jgi:ribosome-binding protein aMBF1 (putative translation factor)
MMSDFSYKQIKAALIKQRADIIASPEYASKLIDDLGIRDLLVPKNRKGVAKKATLQGNQYHPQMIITDDAETLLRFGANLRKLRKERKLSLRQLSYLCKVDHSKIGAMERGEINITLLTMKELALGLGVHPSTLLDFKFD